MSMYSERGREGRWLIDMLLSTKELARGEESRYCSFSAPWKQENKSGGHKYGPISRGFISETSVKEKREWVRGGGGYHKVFTCTFTRHCYLRLHEDSEMIEHQSCWHQRLYAMSATVFRMV